LYLEIDDRKRMVAMPTRVQLKQALFWFSLVAISWLSLLPGDDLERSMHVRTMSSSGAFLHIAAYAVLALLAWMAFDQRYRFAVLFLLLYSIVLEILQIWVPHRSFNPLDILSNLAGLILASMVIFLWQRFQRLPG
ncbi:hypothetical protein GF406_27115, partial [candidate division KSB1 bacterium]|nr:hypothetical protein [candidate division KSB1 bacterium]